MQPYEPTSAVPYPTSAVPVYSAPPLYLPPAPPPIRARKTAWTLAIVCAALIVVSGIGGAIFYNDLSTWNRTIADQETRIAELEKTVKSRQQTYDGLEDEYDTTTRARGAVEAVAEEARRCRDAVDVFNHTPLSDRAAVDKAWQAMWVACQAWE